MVHCLWSDGTLMGIISPKRGTVSKAFTVLVLIGLSPILLIAVLIYSLWGAILYLTIWLTSKKPFVVFVYSDSPIWKDYVEREIIPHIQNRAIILNWSERRNWKNSLAVLAFRYFGAQEFQSNGNGFSTVPFCEDLSFLGSIQA